MRAKPKLPLLVLAAILVTGVAGTTVAAPASKNPPQVIEVIPDYELGELSILGHLLAEDSPTPPVVELDGSALTVIDWSENLIQAQADLDALVPGDYLLVVIPNYPKAVAIELSLTLGAVGPEGAQGEAGNLALAGQSCTPGQMVSGFDDEGDIVCSGDDLDGDGDANGDDNCPFDANASQADTDGDGVGDVCDLRDDRDLDNDGIANPTDNCPFDVNASQADTDADGLGDVCDSSDGRDLDTDGDANSDDNCPFDANASQADTDADGLGDVCDVRDDRDLDNDGVFNDVDNCPFEVNASQADTDADGLGDACDSG